MRLQDVENILGSPVNGRVAGTPQLVKVVADSRQVVPGTLFIAVRGAQVDGHDFIGQAAAKGCLAVVAENLTKDQQTLKIPLFQVSDSHEALGNLAAAWNGNPAQKLHLIGVTGTNGKTTTSWLIERILQQAGVRVGVIGTVNYRYQDEDGNLVVLPAPLTTPDPLQLQALLKEMANAGVSHVIIEVSSHALDQKRLAGITFDVALFTNLSRDHLDYHQDMEAYFFAKRQLFTEYLKSSGTAVVVVDSATRSGGYGNRLVQELGKSVVTVGVTEKCMIKGEQLQQDLSSISCTLAIGKLRYPMVSQLTGYHNGLNMLAASGVAHALDIKAEDILQGLAAIKSVPGRLERVILPGSPAEDLSAVFVDYAHTPDGLENVLKTMKAITPGRLICVFGCGGDRDQGKRPLMGEVAGQLADVVIVSSDNPRSEDPMKIIAEVGRGVRRSGRKQISRQELFFSDTPGGGYLVEADRTAAIHLACRLGQSGDVVIIAGKGHEQYQINGMKKIFFDDRLQAKNGLAQWTVSHLLAASGGRLIGMDTPEMLVGISTDTRSLQTGDVYLALRGESFDGHDFVQAAVDKGAGALIVDQEPTGKVNIPIIVVADTLKALGDLANYRRRLLAEGIQVLALTGSSGKTTVKEMAATILEQFYPSSEDTPQAVLKTQGNFNNLIGLPLSLLPLNAEHKVVVLEMGMNQVGEIERLTEIADPDIACINNIQAAHLEGLGSIEGVASAKEELFAGLRTDAVQVINFDDPQVIRVAKKYQGQKIGYGVTAAGRRRKPVVKVTRIAGLGEHGSRFTLHIGDWKKRITLAAPGIHNVHNAAAATALCHAAGVDEKSIVAGLARYTAVDKRMQFMKMPGGLRVLNDSYNANPASMAAALQTVATFGTDCRRVAALGDMFELGDDAVEAHRKIGRMVADLGFNMLAVTGELSSEIVAGAREKGMAKEQILECINTVSIADWLYHMLISGKLSQDDWLLVKGSRGMRMESLLVELQNRLNPVHGKR